MPIHISYPNGIINGSSALCVGGEREINTLQMGYSAFSLVQVFFLGVLITFDEGV